MNNTNYEIQKLNHELNYKGKLESFKSMNAFALSTMRGLFVANSGAIGILLTFAGSDAKNEDIIKNSVILFAIGVFSAIVVSFSAYCAQSCYTHDLNKRGNYSRAVGIAFSIFSSVCFIWGVFIAMRVVDPLL